MSWRIAPAVTPEERLAAYRLRYRILIGELGWDVPGATEEAGLHEPLDDGSYVFSAFDGDELVGTTAVSHWGEVDLPAEVVSRQRLEPIERHYGRRAVMFSRKHLVTRPYRGTGLGMELYAAAARATFKPEVQFIVTDCAPELEPFYAQWGYRRHAPPFTYGPGTGVSVPICLVVNDVEHLEKVGSPLLPLGRLLGIRDRPDVRAFFHATYGDLPRDRPTGPDSN